MLLSPALVINKNESTYIKGLGTLNIDFSFCLFLFVLIKQMIGKPSNMERISKSVFRLIWLPFPFPCKPKQFHFKFSVIYFIRQCQGSLIYFTHGRATEKTYHGMRDEVCLQEHQTQPLVHMSTLLIPEINPTAVGNFSHADCASC